MNEERDGEPELRIIFRPTKEINKRINKLMMTGRFKTQSELIRNAIWFGLPHLEDE